MAIATYRLSGKLASFEFFNWLVMVQADGAKEIFINTENAKLKNFTPNQVAERVENILVPGVALAGLPCGFGERGGIDAIGQYLFHWFKSGRRFERLKSVKPPNTVNYTITIRDSQGRDVGRDSNKDVWLKFADHIGATVIDDYCNRPIHLHDRMALYAGSKMNFGVCNGPIHILSLTPYPVCMFVNGRSAYNSQVKWGMTPGKKYPWMLPNQHMVWKFDNFDNLLRVFDDLRL